jgi:hypothetical protein
VAGKYKKSVRGAAKYRKIMKWQRSEIQKEYVGVYLNRERVCCMGFEGQMNMK